LLKKCEQKIVRNPVKTFSDIDLDQGSIPKILMTFLYPI